MLRDAECFRSRIGKLDGAAEMGDHLVNIVNSKVVAENAGTPEANSTSTDTQDERPQVESEEKT